MRRPAPRLTLPVRVRYETGCRVRRPRWIRHDDHPPRAMRGLAYLLIPSIIVWIVIIGLIVWWLW